MFTLNKEGVIWFAISVTSVVATLIQLNFA